MNSPRAYPDIFELPDHGLLLRSPAKVNLSLRVVRKRDDGYHDLETVFQELDWYDEIEMYPSDDFSLTLKGARLDSGENNLITRAARALAQFTEAPCFVRIHLRKNLPLQGGVGGGSSNAALTLLGLARLWNLHVSLDQLTSIASALGADCPFFLHGGLARATGRGDLIQPLSGAVKGVFLVVIPDFGVSTADVFSNWKVRLTEVEQNVIFNPLSGWGEGEESPPFSYCNDLENIAFELFPVLRNVRDCLLEQGGRSALLSGSGSSVFAIFHSDDLARAAAHKVEESFGFRTHVCRGVARSR
ncbi:4-(cytidine 5'-diphospho)-2-C-methyl-D-erythritol kinase [bacterium]|nr:4-(cytidine 5'-diphospho)-2-C-methyl-D-erythritol kinase [bacterium]